MKMPAAVLVAALLALAVTEAPAQRFPGRDRGDSPRDTPRREREAPRAAPGQQDPFAALERELPSLKVDLQLKPEQVGAWSLVERGVRELAELDREKRRHLLALRDPGDRPASARDMLGQLAEGDRRRADASTDLQRHFEALYTLLDEPQRRMIDRRVVLSQTEPLGLEPPPRR
ncbi:MAG: hypothetical protein ACM3SO_01240 [Betaproteobacteria bacterium]